MQSGCRYDRQLTPFCAAKFTTWQMPGANAGFAPMHQQVQSTLAADLANLYVQ